MPCSFSQSIWWRHHKSYVGAFDQCPFLCFHYTFYMLLAVSTTMSRYIKNNGLQRKKNITMLPPLSCVRYKQQTTKKAIKTYSSVMPL